MAMMVPMMLPVLIPMLWWYRRSVRSASRIRSHGLTALVAGGYFAIWALLGVAAWAATTALRDVEIRWAAVESWLPLATGTVLLVTGGIQFTGWKARRLAHCREHAECPCRSAPSLRVAWTQGLRMGLQCSLCCGNLMLALLAVGMVHRVAIAAVMVAIAGERLMPKPIPMMRLAGTALALVGLLTIARD